MGEPQRLPLAVKPSNRDETTDRDAKIINGYVEQGSSGEIEVYKRPGFSYYAAGSISTAAAGLGSYNWNGSLYTIFGNTLYKDGVAISGTVDTSGVYTFASCLGATPKLVLQNGTYGYTYDPLNGLVQIQLTTTVTFTGNTTSGSPTITSVSSTTGLVAGQGVNGLNVPTNTTISSVGSGTVTLSANATATGTAISFTADLYVTGTTTSGSLQITDISPNTTGLTVGMAVISANLPALTYITSIDSSTQITLNNSATATGTAQPITVSANFPTNQVPGVTYLDGYINVMTKTAAIWSSDTNNPQVWPDGNYLVAQIEADPGVFLAKQLVYIIAMKSYSIEIFYDAGNASGSPLGPVQGGKLSVGCRSAGSVASMEGALFWISSAKDGGNSVYMMDNLKASQISTPPIDRLLQQADYTTVYSWCARVGGHRFYCVTLVNSNLSLVYDLTSRQWYQWTDYQGNYLPFISSTYTVSDNQAIFQHATNGKMYELEITNTTDDGQTITFDVYTPNYDGGTRKRKYIKIMDFIGDQTNGSVVQVRYSDDDYQTWSNFRTVDMSKTRPMLSDCGTFRRRAYHFRQATSAPLRIQAVEMQIDLGTL